MNRKNGIFKQSALRWAPVAWLLMGLMVALDVGWATPVELKGSMAEITRSPAPAEPITILAGDSVFIDLEAPAERVSVSDPKVTEVMVISPHQIMLNGLFPGRTTLTVWEQGGRRRVYPLTVQVDVPSLAAEFRTVLPDEAIEVKALNDAIVLSGTVREEVSAKKAVEMAKLYHKHVASFLRVLPAPRPPDAPQILLQVRFAEVDRTQGSDLGANWLSTGAGNTIGAASTQQFAPPFSGGQGRLRGTIGGRLSGATSEFSLSDLLNVFAFRPDLNLGLTLRALQTRGLLQILAEPNLITTSGKEASFLAGGEFPYAVVQGGGGGSFPAIHVQFKEFGVRLRFTPTITPSGKIRLKVMPEVSDLDFTNALTISGFTIPSVRTRRADTEIELRDGQSFAIAGLIDHRVIESYSQMPGISRVPVLGALFRSRSQRKTASELVVIVTPQIVCAADVETPPVTPEWEAPYLHESHPGLKGDRPMPVKQKPLRSVSPTASEPVGRFAFDDSDPSISEPKSLNDLEGSPQGKNLSPKSLEPPSESEPSSGLSVEPRNTININESLSEVNDEADPPLSDPPSDAAHSSEPPRKAPGMTSGKELRP